MLFSDGFHRGFHHRQARTPAAGALGLSAGTCVAELLSSPRRSVVKSGPAPATTTVVTVQDSANPKRKKTIITLRRRKQPAASANTKPTSVATASASAPKAPANGVRTPGTSALSRQSGPKPEQAQRGPSTKTQSMVKSSSMSSGLSSALSPPDMEPDSPTSTLLSIRKKETMSRSDSYHSFDSARIVGSEGSCDTAMTQIDDGLSDWGLPKVIDPTDALDQDMEDEADEDFYGEVIPMGLRNALEPSAFPYEPTVKTEVSLREPSMAQRRLQRFLALMYVVLILKRRGVVPPRYAKAAQQAQTKDSATRAASGSSLKKPSVLRILPFASWI